jgi:hypothetical protein
MNKSYFIELTNRLYRITFFFPMKEPLRHKVREVADDILANLVLILEGEINERKEAAFSVEKSIEILDALLELAKSQNWIDSEEIKKIQEKYKEIKVEVEEFNDILRRKTRFYEQKALLIGEEKLTLKKEPSVSQVKKPEKKKESLNLNKRQEKIMDLLKKKESLQVRDIQEVVPEATKRTLRRDLSAMVEKKLLKRTGAGNTIAYSRR